MHAQLDLQEINETYSYHCPSISEPQNPCRCFDSNSMSINRAARQCNFLQLFTIGKYKLFIRETSKYKHLRYEKAIQKRDKECLHPTSSIERLHKSSLKADVVSSYLQFLLSPAMDQNSAQFLGKDGYNEQHDSNEGDEESVSSDREAGSTRSELYTTNQGRRLRVRQAWAEDTNERRELASIF